MDRTSEQAWNLRRACHEHEHWFQNLAELNQLTLSWLGENHPTHPAHDLARKLTSLNALLQNQDDYPENLLSRLQQEVWSAQAGSVALRLSAAPDSERKAVEAELEQSAWKLGRNYGEKQWSGLDTKIRQDLRQLILTLAQSPLYPSSANSPHLIERAVSQEVRLQQLHCPHQVNAPGVASVADTLCRLHFHWCKGFGYALNPRLSIERHSSERCGLKWSLSG